MSGVNISILEGGGAENFGQVTKLKTSNGSGNDLWVPKSDVETKHLSVKKNGLHYTNQYEPTASEKKDGKFHDIYGWDTITVSVKKKVTGKKRKTSPSTGIEYDAPTSVDVDDNGNLVETELPVSIEIKVPPNKLQYYDGESVSKTGMVVKAYYADDTEWGTVPLNELVLDPSVAEGGSDEHSATSDLDISPATQPVKFGSSFAYTYMQGSVLQNHLITASKIAVYTNMSVGSMSDTYKYIMADSQPSTGMDGNTEHQLTNTFTHDGKTVYFYAMQHLGVTHDIVSVRGVVAGSYNSSVPSDKVAWTMVYGEGSGGDSETITAKWTPPEGEDELTDTFDITVIPSN